MPRHFFALPLLLASTLGVTAAASPVAGAKQSIRPATTSSCTTSDTMTTGTNGGPWYWSVTPSEHYNSARSQVYPNACTLAQITGSAGPYQINSRVAPGSYPNLYNISTREQNELFLYGGYPGLGGAYIAKLNADTLEEAWRATVTIPSTQWSFVGAMGILGNGYVYSIQSNQLMKVDPATGAQQILALPQLPAPTGTGAAYNGYVVTASGLIVAKSMERGACEGDGANGIACVIANNLPGTVVIVDPNTMTVLASIQTKEAALGRIMTENHNGIDYIYIAGLSKLVRYTYQNGTLSLDTRWGPLRYGSDGANASGVGLLGEYVVVQTNYFPSLTPSYIVAASVHDSRRQFAIQPFLRRNGSHTIQSWVPDKAAMDSENMRIYAEDTYAHQRHRHRIPGRDQRHQYPSGVVQRQNRRRRHRHLARPRHRPCPCPQRPASQGTHHWRCRPGLQRARLLPVVLHRTADRTDATTGTLITRAQPAL
jgi:hypothetical protein